MHWYAINTKSHNEHLAELNLLRLGVETFYPQIKQRKVIRRKEKTVIGPLFPGYLFARFHVAASYRAVTYARGVRRIVTFGAIPATVDDQIVESIKARLQNGCLTAPSYSFKEGQAVRILEGPLQGLEAIFEREMSGQQRAVLLLRTLAYQARVVVPIEQLTSSWILKGPEARDVSCTASRSSLVAGYV